MEEKSSLAPLRKNNRTTYNKKTTTINIEECDVVSSAPSMFLIFYLSLTYTTHVESFWPCVYTLMTHRRRQNVTGPKKYVTSLSEATNATDAVFQPVTI